MILYELYGTEDHELYKEVQIANINRQYDFLRTIVAASLKSGRPFLSSQLLKALNFHAITCLHVNAGEYRPWEVTVGKHTPPQFWRVQAQMDDFINQVNRQWELADPIVLATFVLWRLNYIHPFINGNGRTARAACYFVLCVKLGGLLSGNTTLPELLLRDRDAYCKALERVDASWHAGQLDLTPLFEIVATLLNEQLETTQV